MSQPRAYPEPASYPNEMGKVVCSFSAMRPTHFWERVQIDGPRACWPWLGRKKPSGYGLYHDGKGSSRHAHRVAYELMIGPVPDEMELDHLCRRRDCVNPYHLEPVTHVENMRRSPLGNGHRHCTHCIHGHPLSGDNVYHYLTRGKFPSRNCLTCNRLRQRRYRQAWDEAQREKAREAARLWRERNREKINARKRERRHRAKKPTDAGC